MRRVRLVVRRPPTEGMIALKAWTFTMLFFAIILGSLGVSAGVAIGVIWLMGLATALGLWVYKLLKGQ
jgi:hypothetical protein